MFRDIAYDQIQKYTELIGGANRTSSIDTDKGSCNIKNIDLDQEKEVGDENGSGGEEEDEGEEKKN